MSEICIFFGIIISMFAGDHNPPHFHIRYGNYKAIITIDKGIVVGRMPGKIGVVLPVFVNIPFASILSI